MKATTTTELKKRISEELKEFTAILIYLAVAFCLLATMKSIVLIQVGINDFGHSYLVAIIEALALSKIVLLGQSISVLKKVDRRPIVVSSFFKAVTLAVIVFLGGLLEEKLFGHHHADSELKQRLILNCAHLLALFLVFYVMFIFRQIENILGPEKVNKLLFGPKEELENP